MNVYTMSTHECLRLVFSGVAALLLAASLAFAAGALVDPGPFGPTSARLEDGRVIAVPAETHAFYRMLTQDGRIQARRAWPPLPTTYERGSR